jgi:hypothetical protein
MKIELGDLNYLAMTVAVAANFALGMAWYTILANPWMAGAGLTKEQVRKSQSPVPYAATAITAFISAWAIAILLDNMAAPGVAEGIAAGLLIGVGIGATLIVTHYLWAMRGWKLIAIDASHTVTGVTLTALILGAWR